MNQALVVQLMNERYLGIASLNVLCIASFRRNHYMAFGFNRQNLSLTQNLFYVIKMQMSAFDVSIIIVYGK